jgi:predicted nucleic acid-binding protein
LIFPEIGHVLWKKARRRRMTREEAEQAFEKFRRVESTVTPSSELIEEAMQMALENGQSPYDCLYVVLSHRSGCPLITADEKLVHRLGTAFPQVTLLEAI